MPSCGHVQEGAGRSAQCHVQQEAATAGPALNQGRAGPGPGPAAPSSHARQPRSTQGARERSSSARSPQHLPDQLLPQGQGVLAVALRRPHGRSPLSRLFSSSPRLAPGAVPLLLPTQGGPSQEEPGPSRSPCGLRRCARVPGDLAAPRHVPPYRSTGGVGGSRNRACPEGAQPLASRPLPNPSPSVPLAIRFHEG